MKLWNILNYWTSSEHVATSSRWLIETSQTVLISEKQTRWILIDRASGWCCSDVRLSSMFICKTLRGIRTHSKARPDGCTGTGCCATVRTGLLQGLFMDIFKQLVISYCIWFDHCLNNVKILIWKPTVLLTQPLHKVFLFYPECSQ
jgi:hypothetical protein